MLTVLLATRNRARILANVLESYCRLESPPTGWKLVVVDNGSTDQTPGVLETFSSRLPLRSLVEPKAGKNFALNKGLELAEGDLTVFTDDDAFPYADWLLQLRRAADNHPEYAMFGGAIVPRWESPPPPWVQWVLAAPGSRLESCELQAGTVFALTDPSFDDGAIPPYLVFGPNMAVRSAVFQSGLRLDPSLGPCGQYYPMGGETELLLELGRLGYKAWHARDARVEHFIRNEQLSKAWILRRAVLSGRGDYRILNRESSSQSDSWMGIPRKSLRRMIRAGLRMIVATTSLQLQTRFRAHWRFNFFRGQIIEARILARERRAHPATIGSKRQSSL